jgi:diaminopropionate ammonia-lyase
MLFANPRATHEAYPARLCSPLSAARAAKSRHWLAGWTGIERGPTPLYALNGLAKALGLGGVLLKDRELVASLRRASRRGTGT